MLQQMAIADAYGIAFEFAVNTENRVNDLSQYYQHPKYGDMKPGCYTDDTQRSLANAQMVLAYKQAKGREKEAALEALLNPVAYLRQYQNVFREDPRPGYSRRFEAFLKEYVDRSETEMAMALNRKNSNGSVMGAAALGFLPKVEEVKMAAAAQALSTHDYTTIPYAQIVALSAFYVINGVGALKNLNDWLIDELCENNNQIENFIDDARFAARTPKHIDMKAKSVVGLMLWALPRHNNLASLIKLAVDIGGDTDSSAAIMVAIASESSEYQDNIPDALRSAIENGPKGVDFLTGIDKALHE